MQEAMLRNSPVRSGAKSGVQDVRLSSERALALAGYVIRLQQAGHKVSLNYLHETSALPHKAPREDPTHPQTADVAAWGWLNDPIRIVDAWQLFESYRANGSTQSLVWVAICDSGYWTDGGDVPIPTDLANCSPMLNLTDSTKPVGGPGSGSSTWHGTWVASCAVGIVDNGTEGAGSGGTIARGALFRTSLKTKEILDCLTYATAWGLDIVNISLGRVGGFDDDDFQDLYNDTFQWAADNGTIIVVSAGNNNLQIPENEVRPASHTPGVISVGNVDHSTWTACAVPGLQSNFGSAVHIWAPGTNIVVGPDPNSPFPSIIGTSFSAPFVAGVVAMMLAIRPGMKVEEVRQILRDTAWTGSDGKVTHGLDAYAALKLTMAGKLPDEFEEWAGGGNDNEAQAAILAPVNGNVSRLGPIGGISCHNPGDHDWWKFSLTQMQTVTITLSWYERLASLNMMIEADDEENSSVDSLVETSPAGGITVLSGVMGPGTYRVCVTGGGPTAYEIGVRLAKASMLPDSFEPNNSFETAAPLLFHASQRLSYTLLDRPWWGPGSFDGTLNWRGFGFGRFMMSFMDTDFFLLDGQVQKALQERHCDIDHVDEPIDIFLYDKDRSLIAQWLGAKSLSIKLDKPEIHYLELRSDKQTRYRISTYMMVDPKILPDEIERAKVFPDWWGKGPFVKIEDHPNFHVVEIGTGEHELNPAIEAALRFQDLAGNTQIALLDERGAVIREASSASPFTRGTIRELSIEGLAPGNYFLRTARGAEAVGGKTASLNLLPPLRFDGKPTGHVRQEELETAK